MPIAAHSHKDKCHRLRRQQARSLQLFRPFSHSDQNSTANFNLARDRVNSPKLSVEPGTSTSWPDTSAFQAAVMNAYGPSSAYRVDPPKIASLVKALKKLPS